MAGRSVTRADVERAAGVIRGRVHRTPTLRCRTLGPDVFLKAELLQRTGSFKPRGVLTKLASLTEEETSRGVIAISAGNHAQAVAWGAAEEGLDALVVMWKGASEAKLAATRGYGATVDLEARDPTEAFERLATLQEETGRTLVHPFDDPLTIAGQGTVGLEILEDVPGVETVVVPIGGGGLIGGIGAHLERVSPETQVVGCWPENSPALYECLRAGRIIDVPEQPTWSTSTAGGVEPGAITFDLCRRVIDRKVLVTEAEIVDAARRLYRDDGELVEGAAAVAAAAFLRTAGDYPGKTVALLLCGGNAEPEFAAKVTEA